MPAFKPQQRHLTINDRGFHFVSYEGRPANTKRGELGFPAMWYLMVEGRRCPVLPHDAELSEPELDDALTAWVEANAIGSEQSQPDATNQQLPASAKRLNWWGLD